MTFDPATQRKRQLAAIHVARAQLGMEEDTYRDLVRRVSAEHGAQASSAGQLDDLQRQALLDELRLKGAPVPNGRKSHPGKPHNFASAAMPEMITKIEAQLADMKLPWSYADAIAKQQFGVARVAWVRNPDQLRAIIAALHVEQEKRQLDAAVDDLLGKLGMSPLDMVAMLRPLRPNWRRHRPSLRLVRDHLSRLLDTRGTEQA